MHILSINGEGELRGNQQTQVYLEKRPLKWSMWVCAIVIIWLLFINCCQSNVSSCHVNHFHSYNYRMPIILKLLVYLYLKLIMTHWYKWYGSVGSYAQYRPYRAYMGWVLLMSLSEIFPLCVIFSVGLLVIRGKVSVYDDNRLNHKWRKGMRRAVFARLIRSRECCTRVCQRLTWQIFTLRDS